MVCLTESCDAFTDMLVRVALEQFVYSVLWLYTPPPSDKKSQTWSETLGISYSHRHGPGLQLEWIGGQLEGIGVQFGKNWGSNWNGLGSNVKALSQERAVLL